MSFTFKIPMSLTTGAEMVVIRKRMEAENRRKVPMWWTMPVLAILTVAAVRVIGLAGENGSVLVRCFVWSSILFRTLRFDANNTLILLRPSVIRFL
jgi:hypothetical protein